MNKLSDNIKARNGGGKENNGSIHKFFFQPKLTISTTGDAHKREADATAYKVMKMGVPGSGTHFFKPSVSSIQRTCASCEPEEKRVSRKESSRGEIEAAHDVTTYIASLGSHGQRLPETSRHFFEPRFAHDFSNVRIHTDAAAARSAQAINALAYTTGNNIVFSKGQYAPDSASGGRLLAHELTHIVQQGQGTGSNIQKEPALKLPPEPELPEAPARWIPRVIEGGAGKEVAEEVAKRGFLQNLGRLRYLGPAGAFLGTLLYPSETAPAWMDEINPLNGQPYQSPDEYRRVKRMSPQERDAERTREQSDPHEKPEEKRKTERDKCRETNSTNIDCENGETDMYKVIESETGYKKNQLGKSSEFDSFSSRVGIKECGDMPGITRHIQIKGSRKILSIFGCICCDASGFSGYIWRRPHIHDKVH